MEPFHIDKPKFSGRHRKLYEMLHDIIDLEPEQRKPHLDKLGFTEEEYKEVLLKAWGKKKDEPNESTNRNKIKKR